MRVHPTSTSSTLNGASSIFWHAVTTCNSVNICVSNWSGWELCPNPVFTQFLGDSPWLQFLEFREFAFNEGHCRALATLERTDLEVNIMSCNFDAGHATNTFIEWLRRGRVLSELDRCDLKKQHFSALNGNRLYHRTGSPPLRGTHSFLDPGTPRQLGYCTSTLNMG
jgi:hypothetical protein